MTREEETMITLSKLRRFAAMSTGEEVRDYMTDNAEEIAALFDVGAYSLVESVKQTPIDRLPRIMVLQCKTWEKRARQDKARTRSEKSAKAAAALGETARAYQTDVVLDLQHLMSRELLDGVEVLVFTFEPWHSGFAVDATRLLALSRLKELDVAYINNEGLHLRWAGGRGGMNLRQTLPNPLTRAKGRVRDVAIPLEARIKTMVGPSIAKAEIRRAS
jgi:hypothetical protein